MSLPHSRWFSLLLTALLMLIGNLHSLQGSGLTKSLQSLPEAHRIFVVFVGNSITAGAGLGNRVLEAPPVHASEYLRQQREGVQVEYSNQGMSGFTTVDFLPDTHIAFTKVTEAGERFSKQEGILIFSISLGTNDSAEEGPNGAPLTASSYRDNLKTIIDSLVHRFSTCLITIHHPIWYSPNTYNRARYLAAGLARLQTYSPEISALTNIYTKIYPGRIFEGDREGFRYFEQHHLSDMQHEQGAQGVFFLHPNASGAKALGRLWGKALSEALDKHMEQSTKKRP